MKIQSLKDQLFAPSADLKLAFFCINLLYFLHGHHARQKGHNPPQTSLFRGFKETKRNRDFGVHGSELKKAKLEDNLLFEASGGINEKSVIDYAKTGIDIISMGCLTMEAGIVDMSLKVL